MGLCGPVSIGQQTDALERQPNAANELPWMRKAAASRPIRRGSEPNDRHVIEKVATSVGKESMTDHPRRWESVGDKLAR